MGFGDLDKGIDSLIRLAALPLVLVVVFSLISNLLVQLPPVAFCGLIFMLVLLSPLAYFIRENLEGHPHRQGARCGAERTPLVPADEEEQ